MADNKQQTAVDFIFDELASKNLLGIFTYEQFKQVEEILNQAKEMEREQIINAFWNGDNTDCTSEQNIKDFADQYYNETYGGGNK
jgi:hypothetical protein